MCVCVCVLFFFQAEDGIRDLVRSRGLGDVYKRQVSVSTSFRDYFRVSDVMDIGGSTLQDIDHLFDRIDAHFSVSHIRQDLSLIHI